MQSGECESSQRPVGIGGWHWTTLGWHSQGCPRLERRIIRGWERDVDTPYFCHEGEGLDESNDTLEQ
jgi:hypothetical protein